MNTTVEATAAIGAITFERVGQEIKSSIGGLIIT